MTKTFFAAATLVIGAAALLPTTASAGGYGYGGYGYTVYVAPQPYVYVAPKRYYKHYYAPKYYGYSYGGYGY